MMMDTSANCSPQLEGAGIFQPGVYRGIEMNQFCNKFFLLAIYKQCENNGSSHG